MKKAIEFLMVDDSLWEMDTSNCNDISELKETYGLSTQDTATPINLNEFLKARIIESLSGNNINATTFADVENHLLLEFYVAKETDHFHAAYFLHSLRYFGIRLDGYNTSKSNWVRAKAHLQALISITPHKPDRHFRDRPREIAQSVLALRSFGYEANISCGKVQLSHSDEEKFEKAIHYRFSQLGVYGFEYIMQCISSCYSEYLSRFRFRNEPGMLAPSEKQVPWGYLFNVSLSFLQHTKMTKRHPKTFGEIVDISKHHFATAELQPLLKFEEMCRPPQAVVDDTQKTILYDQHFAIDQISPSHLTDMLTGIFCGHQMGGAVSNAKLYTDILRWTSGQNKDSLIGFTFSQLAHGLDSRYSNGTIAEALKNLSFELHEVNDKYLSPSEISKRNYYERPFIRVNDRYLYAHRSLCGYGFYSVLTSELSNTGADANLIGKAVEGYVADILKRSGITYYDGVKYKIPTGISQELKIKSKERECDFVVETENTIIFIELKRKTLTTSARSGNPVQSLLDISKSLIHALVQSGCHEYCLRKQGELKFTNGQSLELKNRNVERISLSLFDFFGIQDDAFINHFLISLINAKLDSEDKESIKEIEKYSVELQNQYRTDLFKERYCFQGSYQYSSFMNCRYFSVPQFLEILKNINSNEGFETELKRTRHMTTGSKDWYFDYSYSRYLEAESEKKKAQQED